MLRSRSFQLSFCFPWGFVWRVWQKAKQKHCQLIKLMRDKASCETVTSSNKIAANTAYLSAIHPVHFCLFPEPRLMYANNGQEWIYISICLVRNTLTSLQIHLFMWSSGGNSIQNTLLYWQNEIPKLAQHPGKFTILLIIYICHISF